MREHVRNNHYNLQDSYASLFWWTVGFSMASLEDSFLVSNWFSCTSEEKVWLTIFSQILHVHIENSHGKVSATLL